MSVVITSRDGRERRQLTLDLPADQDRLVLVDSDGSEYHFGRGAWRGSRDFAHVATYRPDGTREPYAWWWQFLDGMSDEKWEVRDDPELGPKLMPLALVALDELARRCTKHNGFGGWEKTWAVVCLRTLWFAREHVDPAQLEVWAATHGWSREHAQTLGEMATRIRIGNGGRFFDFDKRLIRRDPEVERKLLEAWNRTLAEDAST